MEAMVFTGIKFVGKLPLVELPWYFSKVRRFKDLPFRGRALGDQLHEVWLRRSTTIP
jgi:hypothetical protein